MFKHVILIVFFALSACTFKKDPLGSAENPIKFYFVPSVDNKVLADKSKVVQKYLEANTDYKFEVAIPNSYVAVVEAFGTKRADVASLNTFGYLLANEKYGVEARLTVIRFGRSTYRSQIVARADGPIKSIQDISGKKFAFVDPASTSGYLLPSKLLMDNNIKPSETTFAKQHGNVITMLYQKQVDAGATFYSPPEEGVVQDARRLVKTQYPNVEKEIKIIQLTEPIPNDPIVFRKEMPEEMKVKITDTLIQFMTTPEGKQTMYDIFGVTAFEKSDDKRYDYVREMLKTIGKSANELMTK